MHVERRHPRHAGGLGFRRRSSAVALLAALALGGAAAGRAQISPLGGEFQVNTYTNNNQISTKVAADSVGNFVVVWQSDGSSGSDSSLESIQAQLYAANGDALGGQFQVNTYTTNIQDSPAVAADSAGNLVVAWRSGGSSGTDTSDGSIQVQRYGANGGAQGPQFQVNSYTLGSQGQPELAADSAGNFVVVWASDGSGGTDTSFMSIQAQRYDASGVALGGQFQVNSFTTGFQYLPAVAADSAGNFVVVWHSGGSSGTDTSNYSIQAQRYAANGAAQGGQFQVNTYTTSFQREPNVAADSLGNFVVAWMSVGSSGTDPGESIQAQRYAANGAAQGGQFQVNTFTTGQQGEPELAVDGAGNFVVVWHSGGSSGTDTSTYSIQARRYAANGLPMGDEAQVNTYTTNSQSAAAVTADSLGNFVVAWSSDGSSDTDTIGRSIQARRFGCVFCDGFESSDTDLWSFATP